MEAPTERIADAPPDPNPLASAMTAIKLLAAPCAAGKGSCTWKLPLPLLKLSEGIENIRCEPCVYEHQQGPRQYDDEIQLHPR